MPAKKTEIRSTSDAVMSDKNLVSYIFGPPCISAAHNVTLGCCDICPLATATARPTSVRPQKQTTALQWRNDGVAAASSDGDPHW